MISCTHISSSGHGALGPKQVFSEQRIGTIWQVVLRSQGVSRQSSHGSVQSSSSHSEAHLEVQSSTSQQEAAEEQTEGALGARRAGDARMVRGPVEDGARAVSWTGQGEDCAAQIRVFRPVFLPRLG